MLGLQTGGRDERETREMRERRERDERDEREMRERRERDGVSLSFRKVGEGLETLLIHIVEVHMLTVSTWTIMIDHTMTILTILIMKENANILQMLLQVTNEKQ